MAYADAADEFAEICSLTNPTVKKLLLDFADECDAAVVHLKAAALPRRVLKSSCWTRPTTFGHCLPAPWWRTPTPTTPCYMLAAYARDHGAPLAEQAYLGAARAEKKHAALLERGVGPEEGEPGPIYVCPICGYLMTGDSIPDSCPVCGGSRRQYEAFGI